MGYVIIHKPCFSFDLAQSVRMAIVLKGCVLSLQDGSLERLARESDLLEKAYGHYFDLKIVNNDIEETITVLQQAIGRVSQESQWVPVSWVY